MPHALRPKTTWLVRWFQLPFSVDSAHLFARIEPAADHLFHVLQLFLWLKSGNEIFFWEILVIQCSLRFLRNPLFLYGTFFAESIIFRADTGSPKPRFRGGVKKLRFPRKHRNADASPNYFLSGVSPSDTKLHAMQTVSEVGILFESNFENALSALLSFVEEGKNNKKLCSRTSFRFQREYSFMT